MTKINSEYQNFFRLGNCLKNAASMDRHRQKGKREEERRKKKEEQDRRRRRRRRRKEEESLF